MKLLEVSVKYKNKGVENNTNNYELVEKRVLNHLVDYHAHYVFLRKEVKTFFALDAIVHNKVMMLNVFVMV